MAQETRSHLGRSPVSGCILLISATRGTFTSSDTVQLISHRTQDRSYQDSPLPRSQDGTNLDPLEPITSPKQRVHLLSARIEEPFHIRQRFKRRIAILMLARRVAVRFRYDDGCDGLR
jgi:hypothetical protein